jgi:8-oxo-dGTP pyrophosphatase MutT (NUDIX family)
VTDLDLDAIRAALARRPPRRHEGPAKRWAAVAAVLRPGPRGAEVLLIRRAERPGDPWSGHMAFPGGHREPHDEDLIATARRETREEVGLDLSKGALIGGLDERAALARGEPTGMVIAPYVFALERSRPIVVNPEVVGWSWAPLGALRRGEHSVTKEIEHRGQRRRFPGYAVDAGVVWGLTHRMLQSLFDVLDASALPFDEP